MARSSRWIGLAEAGVQPVLEFFNRNPNTRLRTFLMVAPGKAKEVSKLAPVIERFPHELLRELGEQQTMPLVTTYG